MGCGEGGDHQGQCQSPGRRRRQTLLAEGLFQDVAEPQPDTSEPSDPAHSEPSDPAATLEMVAARVAAKAH